MKLPFHNVRDDLLASIVVFLVALPLCMGIAIASGAPVAAGLITGIVGGLIVGTLAGSPLQVSGPAAGLTVIVYDIVQRFGLEMLGLTVLIAGSVQLLAGVFRLGQWFRAVSPAVIKGMLAGIGVLIFASQFHVMVDDKPKGSGIENLVTIPQAIAKGLGVPQVAPKEERQFRTEKMRQIIELHREQVLVHEYIAELRPHAPEEGGAAPASQLSTEADAFAELVDDQAAITQELETVVAELLQFQPAHNGEAAKSTWQAAQAALIASQATLEDLQNNDLAGILASQREAEAALETLVGHVKNHNLAALIGILTIAVILGWQAFAPRSLKVVPAPLVAVVMATIIAAGLFLPVIYVEVPDNLMRDLHLPSMAVLQEAPWGALLKAGLVVAAVASAETLLCATAVDQLHQGPRTAYDKELAAQGVGNMVCGLLGALPMTGVIVRSSANVQAGGKSRLSAILHGLWLLVFVVVLGGLLRLIPTSSLAAMLVYTGWKLVNPKAVRDLWEYGKSEVAIYVTTVVMIVVTDLLTGVLVGIGLSTLKLLYTFSRLKTRLTTSDDGRKVVLSLQGAATFIRLPKLASVLERVPRDAELHVDFEHLAYIDHACLDLLASWARQHQSTGGNLVIDWDSLHARFRDEPLVPATDERSAFISNDTPVEADDVASDDVDSKSAKPQTTSTV